MLQKFPMYAYIPAKDMARARAFYEGKLGFVVKEQSADGVVYEFGRNTACFLYATPNAGTSKASQAFWLVDDVDREIKFPVFRAAVEPDIRFFGFDLSAEQARGAADPQVETDDWGYYFVIQQLPGEPRFGMDVSFAPDDDPNTPITWNDLAWTLFPDGQGFIDTSVLPQSFVPAGSGENLSQWGTDSARMAYILFQNPVMIAVHAKEMLEGLS